MTRMQPGQNGRRRWAWLAGAAVFLAGLGSAQAADLCGCWEGRWHGCTDGRTGTVKAIITRCDDTHYHCRFRGTCFGVFPYWYQATLIAHTDPQTGCVHFRCTRKIPIWGCYWMKGSSDGCTFFARYHTDDHVGYFQMRRVCCP